MKRLFLLTALMLAMVGMHAATPQVIAHRGYWKTDGSAQNSIRSLIKADSIGCYGSEFDVWLTADGVLVVNHNSDINGKIIETGQSGELLEEKLPNGEYLPTLEQYLDAAKDLKVELILEVKPHKDQAREDLGVPQIIEMVNAKGLADRTTYITFSRHAFDLLVEQSGRPVYFLTSIEPQELKEAGGTGPDYNQKTFRRHPDWWEQFRQMGMPINVWTVSNPADLQFFIDHEADYITTDTPEDAMAMIAEQYKPIEITVMTYNLHAGVDASVDSIAAVINSASPDFVALQEVDAYTMRGNAKQHNGKNFIAELAAKTGMFPLYGRTLNFAGGYYGIGLLSKHPCVQSECVELPNPDKVEPRVLLEGVFEINGKRKVIFSSTHLSVESETTRALQAAFINDRYADAKYPVMIGGDFNSEPASEPVAKLSEAFSNLSDQDPTFPSVDSEKKLDYIFGKNGVSAKSAKVIKTVGEPKSDHCPVVVVLSF